MEWLTIIGIAVGVILLVVYAVVGTIITLNYAFSASMGAAFGWGSGASTIEMIVLWLFWPILLPIGFVWGWIEDWMFQRKLDKIYAERKR
jgi:hypothetical protein